VIVVAVWILTNNLEVGVIPSGAVLQAEREPALSGAEGDLPRIVIVVRDQCTTILALVGRAIASARSPRAKREY
jgi:hypothetical protein